MNIPPKAMYHNHTPVPTTSRLRTQLLKLRHLQRNNGTNFKESALRQLVTQYVFQLPQMNSMLNVITGRRETLATVLIDDTEKPWITVLANEWDRLRKCIQDKVAGTDTIIFIHKSEVPVDYEVTYGNFSAITAH